VDVLLGRFDGTFALLDNTGTPQQPRFALIYARDTTLFADPQVDIGQNSTPAFADLDGDGDLDLIVGEAAGTVNFFRNTGTPQQPRFVLEAENVGGLDAGARSAPTLHDVTGDGIPDLVVGTRQDGVRVYRHTGTAETVIFVDDGAFPVAGTVPLLAAPAFADLDGDGDADFLMGGLGGGLFFYRNEAVGTAVEAPSAPLRFRLSVYPNPFREATTLRFRLARGRHVRLVVYDVWGRVVAVPVDGLVPSGEHHASFEAHALPSGVYLYRLTADDGMTAAGTMMRVR
jgi:hypothetical protein